MEYLNAILLMGGILLLIGLLPWPLMVLGYGAVAYFVWKYC